MSVRILVGDCRDILRSLPERSVQTVVTSPPYYGLREYGIEASVWGGDPTCDHLWGEIERGSWANGLPGPNGASINTRRRDRADHVFRQKEAGSFCQHCGAWRGQLGLEPQWQMYVANIVEVFDEVWRVLRDDGTLWLNLGDCYATSPRGNKPGDHSTSSLTNPQRQDAVNRHRNDSVGRGTPTRADGSGGYVYFGPMTQPNRMPQVGMKTKDKMGMPWRIAFALQERGWYLRQDIIWHKPSVMPESIEDRCTTAHEYIFLMAKSGDTLLWRHRDGRWTRTRPEPDYRWIDENRNENLVSVEGWRRKNLWRGFDYYYDGSAIAEPTSPDTHARAARGRNDVHKYSDGGPGDHGLHRSGKTSIGRIPGVNPKARKQDSPEVNQRYHGFNDRWKKQNESFSAAISSGEALAQRNKRSVWTVASEPFPESHFATFPSALVEPCILAGSAPGDLVLDPFGGAGTVAMVAERLQRDSTIIEIKPAYAEMARARIEADHGITVDQGSLFGSPIALQEAAE